MGKVNQARSDGDHYGYRPLLDATKKRLDLNDLLRRAEDEKSRNKKINLLIFSGAASAVLVFLLLLSI